MLVPGPPAAVNPGYGIGNYNEEGFAYVEEGLPLMADVYKRARTQNAPLLLILFLTCDTWRVTARDDTDDPPQGTETAV
jgi:hypothetical protein